MNKTAPQQMHPHEISKITDPSIAFTNVNDFMLNPRPQHSRHYSQVNSRTYISEMPQTINKKMYNRECKLIPEIFHA